MSADDRLATVRSGYDTVAESYARLLPDAGFEAPADRGMIEAFAAYVNAGNIRSAVDAGCGSGRMTWLLSSLGLDISGIDLSAGMIAVARRTYPELSFEVAELSDLPYADRQLGGVFAWYSIIHSRPKDLPRIFAEFFRVLAPGGYAMLGFQVGEGRRHLSRAYGHDVSMEAHLFTPEVITDYLTVAGFDVIAQMTRRPGALEKAPQAVLLAHRPAMATALEAAMEA
ncbi:class I SAM-dependent DNA methyltransferase [Arthrobacter sp. CG_A4]|uniref:class I SAM-dependent DNA methyltransferase n=1 Tax=Arthrobacter sp. CG_A4 TaxID=3071706 RepID=UPI002DFC51FE|nr:ubiquinone/menaquinone biosynthesis C-methylase UbiE [Arthrobacter sp. CG_A4]